MKIVINECFGGFTIDASKMAELGLEGYDGDVDRTNEALVAAVEAGYIGGASYAKLVVVEIPDGTDWHIHEYDGLETIHSAHKTYSSYGEHDNCDG